MSSYPQKTVPLCGQRRGVGEFSRRVPPLSVLDEWVNGRVAVQLADKPKPIKGQLVEHNARGLVLALRIHRQHEEGIFAGITEYGEALYFAPWFRVKAIATSAQLTNVS